MQNFETLGLQPELLRALEKLNFKTPTPIQAQAIPAALEGKDIMGTAQTGTGKTAAFGIPLISHLLKNPQDHALIMTPTRELATQVADMLQKLLGNNSSIALALLIGGAPMQKQIAKLRRSPRLIVGTPGRINDHLQRRSVNFINTTFLVLDETDRMLDMGFGVQIDRILTHMTAQRQTLLFSATLPSNILKLSAKYLNNPVRISVGNTNAPATLIKQETIQLSEGEKYNNLLSQLEHRKGSIIVFVKTKHGADRMAKKLRVLKHSVDAIHGNLRQNQRDRAIKAFRNYETRIMVATDVAARGLDIPHIEHVINYDLPQRAEDYIHRIGRTARNGAEGEAVNLVTPQDAKKWTAIRRLLNPGDKGDRSERGERRERHERSDRNNNSGNNHFRRKNSGGNHSGRNSNPHAKARHHSGGNNANHNDNGGHANGNEANGNSANGNNANHNSKSHSRNGFNKRKKPNNRNFHQRRNKGDFRVFA